MLETERNGWLADAAVLRGRMDEAAQGFASGLLTMAQLTTINGQVEKDLAEVETRLTEWRPAYQASALLADAEAMWQRLN